MTTISIQTRICGLSLDKCPHFSHSPLLNLNFLFFLYFYSFFSNKEERNHNDSNNKKKLSSFLFLYTCDFSTQTGQRPVVPFKSETVWPFRQKERERERKAFKQSKSVFLTLKLYPQNLLKVFAFFSVAFFCLNL